MTEATPPKQGLAAGGGKEYFLSTLAIRMSKFQCVNRGQGLGTSNLFVDEQPFSSVECSGNALLNAASVKNMLSPGKNSWKNVLLTRQGCFIGGTC